MQRKTKIIHEFLKHPAGSVLIETGDTKVICTISVQEGVPSFLDGEQEGWLTAEYNMLPGATDQRFKRERKKISGRTAEIQRLIGRSLRAVADRSLFAGYTLIADCDVLQADGGTRTASITGACAALNDAFQKMIAEKKISENPLKEWVAAISVGIVNGNPILDLCYQEDSQADVDMNVVMTENGKFIEIQGTAENATFDKQQLDELLELAAKGIRQLIDVQKSY
ncbi:MAG: ribonuclease PH [Candidatus Cloacimonadota bacterium]|nr:ribonuclease PH [Candidatus Cloacimonadota bacterium]